jgi:hypothetical protein
MEFWENEIGGEIGDANAKTINFVSLYAMDIGVYHAQRGMGV